MKALLLVPFTLLTLLNQPTAYAFIGFDEDEIIVIDDSKIPDEKEVFNECDEEVPFCKLGQKINSWTVRFHGITGDAFYEFSSEEAVMKKRTELIARGLCK